MYSKNKQFGPTGLMIDMKCSIMPAPKHALSKCLQQCFLALPKKISNDLMVCTINPIPHGGGWGWGGGQILPSFRLSSL